MSNLYIENEVESVKLTKAVRSKYPVISTSTTASQFTGPLNALSGVVDVTTATQTLTAAQSGSTVLLDVATTTVTLPTDAAGLWYNFVVVTGATAQKVIISSASSFFTGGINVPVAAGTAKYFFGDGSTLLSINLNGGTTGGLQGGQFTVVCLKPGLWEAYGTVEGVGTVATPFLTS